MNCNMFNKELIEMVLTPGTPPGTAAVAHMKVCPACTEEYRSFEQTFRMLDSWYAPQPTSYFDQRLAVRLREEQAAPRMGWFERLETRLNLNSRHNVRATLAGALGLVLIVGGGSFAGISSMHPTQHASATVNDLQILDRNEQAFQQMDVLQQEDEGSAQPSDTTAPVVQPSS